MKMRMLTRMILFVLLPSFLGLISLTVISDNLASKSLRTQIVDDLSLLVQVQARELDNVVALLRSTALNLSNTAHVIEYLEAVETKHPDIAGFQIEAKETLDSMVKQYARIQAAGILGLDGKMLAHTNPAVQGQDVSTRGYYLDSVKQGKTTVFTAYSDVVKSFVCLIATPVKFNDKIIGAALIDVDLTALSASTTEQVRIGKTGFCYFLTPDGKIISHPDKAQVGKDLSGQSWMQDIMKNAKGYISYTLQDVDTVAFYAHVTNTNWPVIISVETDDLLSPIADMNRTILIVALSIIALVGCIIFFISKGMATVLRGSADMARFVADGNLTLTPEYAAKMDKNCRRTDEIGDLSKAMQAMIANLAELFTSSARKTQEAEQATAKAAEAQKQAEEAARKAETAKRDGMLSAAEQLEGAVQIITSASTQLSTQIEQSERGASEQAARMTETATAMEEMNSTVLEVAKNAGSAADISASTRHKAEAGADVVRKSLKSIQDVQQQSLKLRADMGKLDENAQAISQIMGVISDIADQTNLLALNAAIEAARAGEAGRGFAVVADEVRKLAEKTMASTTDVGNAIRAIQQSATESITQVDHSVTFIEEATTYANLSGKALDEIVSMVDTTADQVRAIATASEQQSSTSDEINNSITMVNSIASDTARAMNEAARAVNNLADQAGVLTRLIENMKQS